MKLISLLYLGLVFSLNIFNLEAYDNEKSYMYPHKRIKPYIGLDLSQSWKPEVPQPFEERRTPGLALNLGFRFFS